MWEFGDQVNKCIISGMYPNMRNQRKWQPSPIELQNNTWNTGLFDCGIDSKICCLGSICLPYAIGLSAHNLDQNGFLVPMCSSPGCFTADIRMRIRQRYNIEGSRVYDYLATIFCLPCSACQMLRETSFQFIEQIENKNQCID